jgi:uncharacterized beta-barrel protein YwiB (DUF1934 family)
MDSVKPVLVTVKSIQRDQDGKDFEIELVSTGKYYRKAKAQYIVYEESEITGMAGVTTVIKLTEDKAMLIRLGKIHQRQEFRKGETNRSTYVMPFGEIQVEMKTYELEVDLQDGIGTIVIGYDVLLEGLGSNYNQLTITVQEDKA